MRRLLTLALLALACVVVGPVAAASAGCLADAKAMNYDLTGNKYAGHGGMHCTTNNGTNYRLVLYSQALSGGSWVNVPGVPAQAYLFSNGGNPMPDNYVSGDKVIFTPCSAIADMGLPNSLRLHATLENQITHTFDFDDFQISRSGHCTE